MHRPSQRGLVPVLFAATLAWPVVLAAQSMNMAMSSAAPSATQQAQLDSARTLLAKYADPFAAMRDGYFSSVACIEYPQGGALGEERFVPGGMGVHFLNPGLVGQQPDPVRPQVLIYEWVRDTLRLAAAEWFVPAQGVTTPPQIFGQPLKGPMHGHEPIMPRDFHHYDLHVWLWKTNPAGVFSSTNPTVHCANGRYTIRDDHPSLVEGHQH